MNSYAETTAIGDFILTVDTVDIVVNYEWGQKSSHVLRLSKFKG